jgi:anti-sigma regulatory factor (Ser/Thr protein kinase)
MAEVRQLRLGGSAAPAAARELVSAMAERAHADEAFAERLRLVVSEVVTNSVRHGCPGDAQCVEVTVEVEPARVRLEVADEGPGFEPVPTRGRPDRPGGWGLYLVDSLADRWGVEESPTTRVWLELSPRPSAAA